MPQPTITVQIPCTRPDPKPLTSAQKIVTVSTFCVSITTFSSKANPTPMAKEMGITVCIENLYDGIADHLIEGPCCDVRKCAERIDLMNSQFPFLYRDQILDPEWIRHQQEDLKQRIANATNRLKELKDYLMMLKLWKPDSSS